MWTNRSPSVIIRGANPGGVKQRMLRAETAGDYPGGSGSRKGEPKVRRGMFVGKASVGDGWFRGEVDARQRGRSMTAG